MPKLCGQEIHSGRTALKRNKLSTPMQWLDKHDYLHGSYSIFDYGCGQGDDVRLLCGRGLDVSGWDYVHAPDCPKTRADIVNMGFVINVIPDPAVRQDALVEAFMLANKMLLVSVIAGGASAAAKFPPCGDGIVTQRGTFQKYFSRAELEAYIVKVLGVQPVMITANMAMVFKNTRDRDVLLYRKAR